MERRRREEEEEREREGGKRGNIDTHSLSVILIVGLHKQNGKTSKSCRVAHNSYQEQLQ